MSAAATEAAGAPRADTLRTAFDRSFAAAGEIAAPVTADFLTIRVGGDAHLLRLEDIGALHADRTVTRMPSHVPEFAGLARFRGRLLPVYDLAALLGYPKARTMRWTVVATQAPVAFAFETFEGHCRRLSAAPGPADAKRERAHQIRTEQLPIQPLPMIEIASLAQIIARRGRETRHENRLT